MSLNPAATLHLIHAPLQQPALLRWMALRGLTSEDHALHCLLTEILPPESQLRPFRLRRAAAANGPADLYGYCRRPAADLQADLQLYAAPQQLEILPPAELRSKAMPDHWTAGRRLGFDLHYCPQVRSLGADPAGPAHGVALEPYAACLLKRKRMQTPSPPPSAAEVYRDWLAGKLEKQGGARLEALRLRSVATRQVRRSSNRREFPLTALTVEGQLIVADPERFQELLAQGIGRHRAYGYGMLLLKPAANANGTRPTASS